MASESNKVESQALKEQLQNFTEAKSLLSSKEDLCFNIDKFVALDFHVDQFVSECKDRVSLHTLREDLESHYKNIRVALIDLINQDYADFVSLSSNLVGMEKSIEHLRQPLGQLREEIRVSRKGLDDELSLINRKLNHRKQVREKKTKLQHLLNVVSSLEKIEKILFAKPGSSEMEIYMDGNRESMGNFLERVAGEFNQLQFHVNQSKGHKIIDSIKSRVSLITSKLQESLESSFLDGLATDQSELVLRCLRTYALIDKTGHAEDLFRHNFVKPRIERLISEDSHKGKGLQTICDDVIHFVKSDCQMVIKLTTEKQQTSTKDEKEDIVKGFDFLVNTVWPEIDNAFETRLSFIFSPGNPDLFFQRYTILMKFVDEFEDCCTSFDSLQRLRAHSSYQTFMAKWSLPVYFQIRFQEIGGSVEAAIDNPFKRSPEGSEDLFSINMVTVVWKALDRCWDDKVFMRPLLSRFWKLFLQILGRLIVALKDISEEVVSCTVDASEPEEKDAHGSKPVTKHNLIDIGVLCGDVFKLNAKVSQLFNEKVKPLLETICHSSCEQHEGIVTFISYNKFTPYSLEQDTSMSPSPASVIAIFSQLFGALTIVSLYTELDS
eukprot:gene3179-1492_t